jgi:guanyl-specific ribonuclease Sa
MQNGSTSGGAGLVSGCISQASGLADLIQGLELLASGCYYAGGYEATTGLIQLAELLIPYALGRFASAAEVTASEAAAATSLPRRVLSILARVDEKGSPLPGYKGGKEFVNDGRKGAELLPFASHGGKVIFYSEWDVHPNIPGIDRGPERLVTGDDGSAYYTNDHFTTFVRIRGGR